MRKRLIARIVSLALTAAPAGDAFADDLPHFDNPYLIGGATPSGADAYGLGAHQGTTLPRTSAGPLSGQDSTRTSPRVDRLQPGTGRFEGGNNTPCIGSTGFGSSSVIPGRRC